MHSSIVCYPPPVPHLLVSDALMHWTYVLCTGHSEMWHVRDKKYYLEGLLGWTLLLLG